MYIRARIGSSAAIKRKGNSDAPMSDQKRRSWRGEASRARERAKGRAIVSLALSKCVKARTRD